MENGLRKDVSGAGGTAFDARDLVLGAALIVALVHRGWVCTHGFDITDEGYALLASRWFDSLTVSQTGFLWFTGPVFRALGYSIVGFRWFGILLVAGGAAVLGFGLASLACRLSVPAPKPGRCAMTTAIGAFVYYSSGFITPNYNTVAGAGAFASVGFLGVALTRSGGGFAAALSGFAAGAALLSKPPAGAVVLALDLALLALLHASRQSRWSWILGVATGTVGMMAWRGFDEAIASIVSGYMLVAQLESYSLFPLIWRYAREGFWLGLRSLAPAAVSLGASWMLVSATRHRRLPVDRESRAVEHAWPLSVLLLSVYFYSRGGGLGGHRNAVSGVTAEVVLSNLVASVLPGFIRLFRESGPAFWKLGVGAFVAAVLSFAGSFGTNTPLAFSLLFFLAPCFALSNIAAEAAPGPWAFARSTFPVLLAAFLGASGPYVAPYRWAQEINDNVISTQITAGSRLRLDPETARFVRGFRAAAQRCGIGEQSHVLAFVWMPGLVFAAGGQPVAMTHFVSDVYGGAPTANRTLLGYASRNELRDAYVIANERGARSLAPLTLGGRAFPADYEVCFEGTWPAPQQEVRLYRPYPYVAITPARDQPK